MSEQKKVPGWGKTIGILMIVFGGLGVFIQIYKMMIPQIIRMQQKMMDDMPQLTLGDDDRVFMQTTSMVKEMMKISDTHATVLLYSGILGLVGCALYITGGIKLLKIGAGNYNFAKFTLIGFLCLNCATTGLLASGNPTMLVLGMLFYIVFGLIIDLVLMIILMANDKRKYTNGPIETEEIDTVYRG